MKRRNFITLLGGDGSLEGGVHFPDGVGVEGMTRAVDVAAKISKRSIATTR
jgi:hypothetical protein